MKSFIKVALVLTFLSMFFYCATTPEEPSAETASPQTEEETTTTAEPVQEEPKEEPVVEKTVEPLSEEEIAAADVAIGKAKAVSAEIYAKETFSKASLEYETALSLKDTEPDKAREHLTQTKDLATKAYTEAVSAIHAQYLETFGKYQQKLIASEADKFAPEEVAALKQRADAVLSLYDNGDYEKAKTEADQLLVDLKTFYETLDKNIRWAKILRRDTEAFMDDADKVEAYIWAPELVNKASLLFAEGLSEFRNYNLDASISYLADAKGLALQAARVSPVRKAEYKTNSLMKGVEKEIKDASDLTIITEEGEVIGPKKGTNDDQSLNLSNSRAVVLGDVTTFTLLDQAKELWSLGVKEKENQNFEKADEYFEEAAKLIEKYKMMAVNMKKIDVYKKNTLWYIAKKEYGNAYLWPIIWLYNREGIKNPDLIRPGWKVVVPSLFP